MDRLLFLFFFLRKKFVAAIFSYPLLSAISKQSMANCLFNASSWILLKVRHTSRYPPQLPKRLPLRFLLRAWQEGGTNNNDNVRWVMISHFLLTCTPLLVRSVWQWKLIFFSLRGDITMINFSMEWRKLEDCCNMRSEINLLWCERSWGMWGINKYEITLSVFSSNRNRASFGKAPFVAEMWPSLAFIEMKRTWKWNSLYLSAIISISHTLLVWLASGKSIYSWR